MIRLATTREPKARHLAHTALTMLAKNLLRESKCYDPGVSTAGINMLRGACATANDVGSGAHGAPLVQPPSGRPSDIEIGDWDALFCAVEARLRLAVGEQPAVASEPPRMHDTAGRLQAIVLECVEALDQLHAALTQERGRRHQLELQVFNEQTAVAPSLAEFIVTQAGEMPVLATASAARLRGVAALGQTL